MTQPKRKRRGRPEQKQEHWTLRRYVREAITEFKGDKTNQQIMKLTLDKMTAAERADSYHEAVLAVVANEVGIAEIERVRPESGDLFSESYLDRLLRTETGSIHMREATWDHHQLMRERQIKGLRRVNRKFEIDEQRREKLEPVMDGSDIKTEQAVWRLQGGDETREPCESSDS